MKKQSEEESKKVVQRKGNEESERQQKRATGKLVEWRGVVGVRKAWKDWSKKETRRNDRSEKGK